MTFCTFYEDCAFCSIIEFFATVAECLTVFMIAVVTPTYVMMLMLTTLHCVNCSPFEIYEVTIYWSSET